MIIFLSINKNQTFLCSLLKAIEQNKFDGISANLKSGVWDFVPAFFDFENIWKSSNRNPSIVWRFFASQNGVFRIFPAAKMPEFYDATERSWYRTARDNYYKTKNEKV